ncbi:Oligopeptide transporter 3 [Senna tora]|uniref:Oligopeptide transporter 3 n=1 Tax=Senna tora TaxID=362788 RepID=A0A834XDZ4_9FABA|nr:Oligopeptide transporter 3 [Senna tora]
MLTGARTLFAGKRIIIWKSHDYPWSEEPCGPSGGWFRHFLGRPSSISGHGGEILVVDARAVVADSCHQTLKYKKGRNNQLRLVSQRTEDSDLHENGGDDEELGAVGEEGVEEDEEDAGGEVKGCQFWGPRQRLLLPGNGRRRR